MKKLLLLTFIVMLVVLPVLSQTRKKSVAKTPAVSVAVPVPYDSELPPAPVLGKRKASANIFKNADVGKWGVVGVRVPQDLSKEEESENATVNKNVSWTTYSRSWKQPAEYYPSALEIDLTVTTWNNEIKEIIPELRPDLATPEHLILLDLLGDLKTKNTPGSFVKEAKAMDLDNLNGSYFRAVSPTMPNRFMVGWSTYRYYNGKPQNISLTVSGDAGELEKAMEILQSLKIR